MSDTSVNTRFLPATFYIKSILYYIKSAGSMDIMEIASNKKAHFDYEILETYEAGIALQGFEVKSVKSGRISLTGAFAVVKDSELWLLNAHISAFQPQNAPADYDPFRSRKLLMHRHEIKELIGKTAQKGLTIVPLSVYTKRARVKIRLGLGRHKKQGDKRETIKRREAEREIDRTLKRGDT